jgi:deazaflavin-dependent oxidoreductase (nitroreductase family)
VIVASMVDPPPTPAWYHNLKANPTVDVEVGAETFTVVADELDDITRAELWTRLVTQAPRIDDHQAKVTRRIPVIMLTRQN